MDMETEIRALREALHKVEVERDHYKDLAADLEAKVDYLMNHEDESYDLSDPVYMECSCCTLY